MADAVETPILLWENFSGCSASVVMTDEMCDRWSGLANLLRKRTALYFVVPIHLSGAIASFI